MFHNTSGMFTHVLQADETKGKDGQFCEWREKKHCTDCVSIVECIIVWGCITASGTGQLAIMEEIMSPNTCEGKKVRGKLFFLFFWVAKSETCDLKTAVYGQHIKDLEILMIWNGFVGRNGLKCLLIVNLVTANAQILPIAPLTWRNLKGHKLILWFGVPWVPFTDMDMGRAKNYAADSTFYPHCLMALLLPTLYVVHIPSKLKLLNESDCRDLFKRQVMHFPFKEIIIYYRDIILNINKWSLLIRSSDILTGVVLAKFSATNPINNKKKQ